MEHIKDIQTSEESINPSQEEILQAIQEGVTALKNGNKPLNMVEAREWLRQIFTASVTPCKICNERCMSQLEEIHINGDKAWELCAGCHEIKENREKQLITLSSYRLQYAKFCQSD